jgi:hypothetical protein
MMSTVGDPMAITSGGPAQVAMSPTRAAGWLPIITVGAHGGRIGPPTCGTTPVTIGQVCMSPSRAAGGMIHLLDRGRFLAHGRDAARGKPLEP